MRLHTVRIIDHRTILEPPVEMCLQAYDWDTLVTSLLKVPRLSRGEVTCKNRQNLSLADFASHLRVTLLSAEHLPVLSTRFYIPEFWERRNKPYFDLIIWLVLAII